MKLLPRHARVGVIALSAITGAMGLYLVGWLSFRQVAELSVVLVAGILTSAATPRSSSTDRVTMPPSFVTDFTALLLFGPHVALLVAAAGVVSHEIADDGRPLALRRLFLNLAAILTATQAAGSTYRILDGVAGVGWPWQAFQVVAAVAAYATAKGLFAGVILPLTTKQPVNRLWAERALQSSPNYIVGASLALGIAALIQHGMWDVLALTSVPLYFACRDYCAHVARVEDEYRRLEVVASLDEGMAVVDGEGCITFWNDVLERLVGCGRERALHSSLSAAVPALARTELPRAVDDALATRRPHTLEQVSLSLANGRLIFRVKVVPVSGGVTLLWQDITERTRTEAAPKRSEERLAVGAECANDGFWEWDFAKEQFYMTGRWRAMVGLDPTAATGRPEDWIHRVHPDDVAALKAALEATLGGVTERFEREHRIRHEDGGYRRFLCRGLAVRAAGRRSTRIAGSLTETDRAASLDGARGAADALTGLCNRAVFVEGLGRRLDDRATRRGASGFAVLYLDLDRFKVVNDSLGHMVGDELLVSVAPRSE